MYLHHDILGLVIQLHSSASRSCPWDAQRFSASTTKSLFDFLCIIYNIWCKQQIDQCLIDSLIKVAENCPNVWDCMRFGYCKQIKYKEVPYQSNAHKILANVCARTCLCSYAQLHAVISTSRHFSTQIINKVLLLIRYEVTSFCIYGTWHGKLNIFLTRRPQWISQVAVRQTSHHGLIMCHNRLYPYSVSHPIIPSIRYYILLTTCHTLTRHHTLTTKHISTPLDAAVVSNSVCPSPPESSRSSSWNLTTSPPW